MKRYVLVDASNRQCDEDETLEIISECTSKKEAKQELEYFKNRTWNTGLEKFEIEIWKNGEFLSILK
jgi:hypothetical protein